MLTALNWIYYEEENSQLVLLGRYCFATPRIQNLLTVQFHSDSNTVLVCQGHTCSLSGSAQVLVTFQVNSPPDFKVTGCGCLGQCGNGPMVLTIILE